MNSWMEIVFYIILHIYISYVIDFRQGQDELCTCIILHSEGYAHEKTVSETQF